MSGYARFHRSLVGHPAFRNDAEAMAFAYMVLRASWKPTRVRYKGRAVELRRGQLSISQRDMATALDRDKAWVERLWKRLRDEGMVEVVYEAGAAVITICNYDKFQHSNDTHEAVGEAPNEADARQTQGTEQVREEVKKKEISDTNVSSPDLRPEHVVEAWNEMASRCGLAKARLTEPRRRSLAVRIRQFPIEDWTEAISAVERNPWMHGANDKGWRADFDFLLQPKSFTRLIEGSYDRSQQAS